MNEFIDSTIKLPNPTLVNKDHVEEQPYPAYSNWCPKDQLLKSWILSSLSLECITNTIGLSTSVVVWEALRNAYGAPTEAHLVQLHIQLQRFRKNDLPVAVYLQRVKLIADELAAARRPLDPGAFNASIFNNLGLDFSEVVSTLAVRGGGLVSFSELTNIIISHEMRLPYNKMIEVGGASTNVDGVEANLTHFSGGK